MFKYNNINELLEILTFAEEEDTMGIFKYTYRNNLKYVRYDDVKDLEYVLKDSIPHKARIDVGNVYSEEEVKTLLEEAVAKHVEGLKVEVIWKSTQWPYAYTVFNKSCAKFATESEALKFKYHLEEVVKGLNVGDYQIIVVNH